MLCSNRSEWVVVAGAAAKLGAPVVAISTFSSPRELAYALKHSGAKALVMLNRFRDRHFLQALGELCPELARCPPGALQSAALPDLASVVVLGIAAAVLTEVFFRYVLNAPTAWALDAARFALVYVTFFALAPALESGQHVVVDMFDRLLPVRLQPWQRSQRPSGSSRARTSRGRTRSCRTCRRPCR